MHCTERFNVPIKPRFIYFLLVVLMAGGWAGSFILEKPVHLAARAHVSSASSPLTPQEFLRLVFETIVSLREGTLGRVGVGSNIKEMATGMRALYEDSDLALSREIQRLEILRRHEEPTERLHDLPGALGIIEAKERTDTWIEPEAMVDILDGGFKTRFGYKVLSEGWAGLTRLPGNRYRDLRHIVLVNMLTILRMLPDGLARYAGLASSDNFIFLGQATLGGIPLNENERIRPLLERASVVKGAAKIRLLTDVDMNRLKNLKKKPQEWTEKEIEQILSERWRLIIQQIEKEKLGQVGVVGVDSDGRMTGFLEKADHLSLVRFAYQHGGILYKNAFQEFLDRRFAVRLMERFRTEKAQTEGVQTLDQLPISYMQAVYQSRFAEEAQWERLSPVSPVKIALQDWRRVREIVRELFEEEKEQGRGEVYVFDFGEGFLRAHLGDLQEWNMFLDLAAADPFVRQILGMKINSRLDPAAVRIGSKVKMRLSPNGYLERTIVTGEGTLIVDEGALLSSVRIHIPEGKTLHIKRGAKILESDLDLSRMEVEVEPETIIERVFPEAVGRLKARSGEWVTTLSIQGEFHLARNLIHFPFKGKKIGQFIPSKEQWLELQRSHPEYLSQYEYEEVKDLEWIDLADENLGGLSFQPAQREVDYGWMRERIRRLYDELEAGIKPLPDTDDSIGALQKAA